MAQGLVHVWVPKPYKTMVLPLKCDALQIFSMQGQCFAIGRCKQHMLEPFAMNGRFLQRAMRLYLSSTAHAPGLQVNSFPHTCCTGLDKLELQTSHMSAFVSVTFVHEFTLLQVSPLSADAGGTSPWLLGLLHASPSTVNYSYVSCYDICRASGACQHANDDAAHVLAQSCCCCCFNSARC